MSKLKKKKSKSYAKLKIALDRVFSLYVRLRFSDGRGIASCASCGLRSPFKALQCGHFVSRSYLATRWHLENCAPQCVQCNIFKKGNLAAYAAWGVDRYGMDWPARMVSLSKTPTKFSRSDLESMILDYEQRIARLTGDWRE